MICALGICETARKPMAFFQLQFYPYFIVHARFCGSLHMMKITLQILPKFSIVDCVSLPFHCSGTLNGSDWVP